MPAKLTNAIITAAIEGFESQKVRIDHQISHSADRLRPLPRRNHPPASGGDFPQQLESE